MAVLARSWHRGMSPGRPAKPQGLAMRSAFPGTREAGREQSVSDPLEDRPSSGRGPWGGGRRAEEAGTCGGGGRGGLSRLHLPWLFCAAGLTASPRSRRGAPLSAGSLFPGAAGPPCCLHCMFLYCMGIKVYKHMVLCQQGRLGQPTRRCAASPDPELTHQWARRPGPNRLEHPGIATPQPPHHSALTPHLLPAPRSPARPLPSPCRGLSPQAGGS